MHQDFRTKEFRHLALELLQKRPDWVVTTQAYLDSKPQLAVIDGAGFSNFLTNDLRLTTNRTLLYKIQEACKIVDKDAGSRQGLYNKYTLLAAIDFVQTTQAVIGTVFDKMYQKLTSGLPNIFETCGKEDSSGMGLVKTVKFFNYFDRETRISLKANEKQSIEDFYNTFDGEQLDYAEMKSDFIKHLAKKNIRLEDVNGKASEDIRKQFYMTFIAYCKQRQIADPMKFFASDLKVGNDNVMMARYTFQNALSRVVPDLPDDHYKVIEEELIPDREQYVSLNLFSRCFAKYKDSISNADLEKISNLKQAYDPEKILCFYKICEAFERDEKHLKRELVASNSGYAEFLDSITPEKFIDFLRSNKVDVEELTRDRLDHAFLTQNESTYNLKELISYFQTKTTGLNKSIFERSQEQVLAVVKDLVEHLITSKSKKRLIQPIMEQDMDHDGLLLETEFYIAAKYQDVQFDADSRQQFKFRYDEFKDNRINILSAFYDMELVRRKHQPPLEPFHDLPFRNVMRENELMVKFCSRMKEIGMTSEKLVGSLIQLGQSHRIKISLLLLKIVEIMEPVIYAKQTGAGPEPKPAIQWVIEIVQCLDKSEDGTIMDFELATKLNSYLNIEMRSVMEKLFQTLESKRFDLRALFSAAFGNNDLVNVNKLKDVLLREKFHGEEVETFMKRLALQRVDEISLIKLGRKIESEINLMGIGGNPKNVKRVLFGNSAEGQNAGVDERVDKIITIIHEKLMSMNKNFNEMFEYPEKKMISRIKMDSIINSTMRITEYGQYNQLVEMIKDKLDSTLLDLQKFKEIYDAKFGLGGEGSAQSNEVLEVTIKNLKKQLESAGTNVNMLFNIANSNNDDGIDRREFFYFLYMVDNTIKKSESNLIFDRIDKDRTGTISRSEFDNFFALDPTLKGANRKVDDLKWAVHIFQELNVRLNSEW